MEIKKTLDLRASDFMAFITRIYKKHFVLVPVVTVLLFTAGNLISNELTLQSMIFPVVLAALLTLGLFLYLKRLSEKALASFNKANGVVTVTVDEAGVRTSGKLGETALAWRDIIKLIETKTAFLFFIHKTNAVMLPKRQLSADELAELMALIKKEANPGKMWLMS